MASEHAPIVQMKNIEKHFGSVIALAGVSLEVFPGECHCLLGDNDAGKSTFIKSMSGVHKPTRGRFSLKASRCTSIARATRFQPGSQPSTRTSPGSR